MRWRTLIFANVLFFVPWGFLTFIAFDTPKRRRARTYLLTFVAAAIFATAMEIWQTFLPTRVTSPVDAIANTIEHAKALAHMLGVDRPVICGA